LIARHQKINRKSTSRSRKSSAKRESIISAAIEVINAKSYALASITEIAAALGLRDATLYYYFRNKRALAFGCHCRSLQRFEALLKATDVAGGSGAKKLRHFIRGMLADPGRNGQQLYFGDYSYLDASQRRAILVWAERLKNALVRFLKPGMADGSVVQCEPEFVVHADLAGEVDARGGWA
jgi:AcrR family transcriptional regulator